MAENVEYTIDELARAADTTVRSVRVYHERGLLPSPEVRGRVGYYQADHLNRLETISRLLSRGMKLNGIKELLAAWDRGDGLAQVLGVTGAATDRPATDTPSVADEESSPDPELPEYAKRALASNGDPLDTYRLANPRCRDLAIRLRDTGLGPADIVQLVERLRSDCDRIAGRYADQIYQCLAVDAYAQSDGGADDLAKLEMDLAIARLIAARAVTELIDQAFGRSAEQVVANHAVQLAPQP
ncbi:MerR family transcriptional regulator [Nocardia brasiliensis]|uniref:MerR family transcriptional regulator n=1 Tax=Nocardia brasiliensis TaxID=37326 RepID=UPI0024559E75|nr:MerR family transcriptional regulator [Nocardia brasiliensis]